MWNVIDVFIEGELNMWNKPYPSVASQESERHMHKFVRVISGESVAVYVGTRVRREIEEGILEKQRELGAAIRHD